jgi:HSP20 family protein
MAESATKLPVKNTEGEGRIPTTVWRPLGNLHRELDRLFDDLGGAFWRAPFGRGLEPMWGNDKGWAAVPAVDVVEKDRAYEISAELPGIDQKDIELKVSDGVLSITGEKSEEKEEKKKGYHLSERRYGSFARSFVIPDSVEVDKIDAQFKNGVLTVTLPKKAAAMKPEKKIEVKAA